MELFHEYPVQFKNRSVAFLSGSYAIVSGHSLKLDIYDPHVKKLIRPRYVPMKCSLDKSSVLLWRVLLISLH
jgi:hypothetical protein